MMKPLPGLSNKVQTLWKERLAGISTTTSLSFTTRRAPYQHTLSSMLSTTEQERQVKAPALAAAAAVLVAAAAVLVAAVLAAAAAAVLLLPAVVAGVAAIAGVEKGGIATTIGTAIETLAGAVVAVVAAGVKNAAGTSARINIDGAEGEIETSTF